MYVCLNSFLAGSFCGHRDKLACIDVVDLYLATVTVYPLGGPLKKQWSSEITPYAAAAAAALLKPNTLQKKRQSINGAGNSGEKYQQTQMSRTQRARKIR